MTELIIFADDFTGALDAGVQLSCSGLDTIIMDHSKFTGFAGRFTAAKRPAGGDERQPLVIAVNTESRHLPADAAYLRVRDLVRSCVRLAPGLIYKKTDSVLRGNIGAELKGMLDGADEETIVYVPAYPEQKRTTVNGKQYVKGLPIELSEFASDPRTPVVTNNISAVIRAQADLHCIGVEKGSKGAPELRALCSGTKPHGTEHAEKNSFKSKTVFIVDGESRADLDETAEALAGTSAPHCLAGCAGFLASLPKLLRVSRKPPRLPELHGPALVAAGSIHPASIKQVENAAAAGRGVLSFPPAARKQKGFISSSSAAAMKRRAAKILKDGTALIARSLPPGTAEKGLENLDASLLLRNMGAFFAELIRTKRIATLVVFGGDTLAAILENFSFPPITPLGELEAGIVQSRFSLGKRNISLVSKPGSYGDDETLIRILTRIKKGIDT